MKRISILAGVALLALAGCTMSKEKYEVAQTALDGSPKLRSMVVADCVRKAHPSKKEMEILAALTNSSVATVKTVVCRRVVAATASGRLSYADYQAFVAGRPTPKVIRILQGR
ncbi:hypothetical protein ACSBOB_05460 [Mesorhizobium sp. ASY16-5R]|uniref:hypothetical protein n=1 Tax=Mesorhizobium sp. ASY16-5R TaxID=3445772 RepID=UPI003FA02E35